MRDIQKQAAYAAMTEQRHQDRAAALAAEQARAGGATDDHREMRSSDLFKQAFTGTRQQPDAGPGERRWEAPQQRPWDAALSLVDDDAPRPPAPAAEPAPAAAPTAPPVVEPSPQARRLSADEVFAEIERAMAHTPEAQALPADVQLRRQFRALPGSQREAITRLIEAQDYALSGYFDGRNFSEDYRATLVASALARRLADAQRLQPDLSPAALLEQVAAAANPGN